jgi:hypothetical protein
VIEGPVPRRNAREGMDEGAVSLTLTSLQRKARGRLLEQGLIPPISFKRHRFPSDVIRHAVWLYFRFSLSLMDVEEMLARRGIEVSGAVRLKLTSLQ